MNNEIEPVVWISETELGEMQSSETSCRVHSVKMICLKGDKSVPLYSQAQVDRLKRRLAIAKELIDFELLSEYEDRVAKLEGS